MTEVKPGLTLLWQSMLYNQPWRIEVLGEMEGSANFGAGTRWTPLWSLWVIKETYSKRIHHMKLLNMKAGCLRLWNLIYAAKNNGLIKRYFFFYFLPKCKFDWILDNMRLKERWRLRQRMFTAKCMMETDRQTEGGREEKKKNYLDSPFIYSEDNHVTIVASSNFLIKVLRFSSEPSNHIHASFWGVELFRRRNRYFFFFFFWFRLEIATSQKICASRRQRHINSI